MSPAWIELGAGFHPDMTGRGGISISTPSSFALPGRPAGGDYPIFGFGAAIDTSVRTYSSDMYMPLAFSGAFHVDANILLVDKLLTVGDIA